MLSNNENSVCSESELQAMKDNDDFFFDPLSLECQETIHDDIRILRVDTGNGTVWLNRILRFNIGLRMPHKSPIRKC